MDKECEIKLDKDKVFGKEEHYQKIRPRRR